MATHPYISGTGNVAQMIGFLRKNFPANVTADTVKKFSLASNNESYVINALQFLGIIDEDGKRTAKGHDVLLLGDDAFPKAFEGLVRDAYKDIFDLRGDDAWTMSRGELTAYFRQADKTSDVIGSRQAALFGMFRGLAGYAETATASNGRPAKAKKQTPAPQKNKVMKSERVEVIAPAAEMPRVDASKDMALTVRVEINLSAGASKEDYDNIFKSIRENLLGS